MLIMMDIRGMSIGKERERWKEPKEAQRELRC